MRQLTNDWLVALHKTHISGDAPIGMRDEIPCNAAGCARALSPITSAAWNFRRHNRHVRTTFWAAWKRITTEFICPVARRSTRRLTPYH